MVLKLKTSLIMFAVNSHIKKLLSKHFENNSEQIERNSLDQISFFSLPFFGLKSEQMKMN